jgi:hypothetical protein
MKRQSEETEEKKVRKRKIQENTLKKRQKQRKIKREGEKK